jgi:molybdopterin synthase sulfur carrier subunit
VFACRTNPAPAVVCGIPVMEPDMIQMRFFASLREKLRTGEEQIELPAGVADVAGLTRWLQARGKTWNDALSNHHLRVAVNQEIVTAEAPVHDGDEVAWFPPVTGG